MILLTHRYQMIQKRIDLILVKQSILNQFVNIISRQMNPGFRIWNFENPDHFPDSSGTHIKTSPKIIDFFLAISFIFFIIFEFSSFPRKYS